MAIKIKLGYLGCFVVDRVGRSGGGLAFLWDSMSSPHVFFNPLFLYICKFLVCVLVDFNDLLCLEDKTGGVPLPEWLYMMG